jgi:hypothetical protein
LVTIDAMGCQTKIAQTIIDRGADYLLTLKDNQRSLADEVETFFQAPAERGDPPFETIDADHGRIETRRHPCRPRQGQPQGQAKSRSLEPALPPGSHHKNRSVTFKRFSCAMRA